MNQKVSEESKSNAIKILAILGFIAVIIICVWLSVLIVRALPQAFTSLASLAENMSQRAQEDTLEVQSDEQVVDSGETFTLSWNDLRRDGTYNVGYECTDGVSVDMEAGDDTIENIPCTFDLAVPEDVREVALTVYSEKYRSINILYTVSFTEADTEDPLFTSEERITVVNTSIAVGEEPTDDEDVVEPEEPQDDVTEDETDAADNTPLPEPQTRWHTFTYIPISNPYGVTDLQVTVLGAGQISGRTFFPQPFIDNDSTGAIQIEVKNIGTRTSEEWDLTVELPNGEEYELDDEDELKPNERMIIVIGFDPENRTGIRSFEGRVSTSRDTNTLNNNFFGVVELVN